MRSAQLAILLTLATGCNAFYDTSTSTSVTSYGFEERTFDDRLPDALEYLFWDCTEPLVMMDGQTEVDLLGNCDSSYYRYGSPEHSLAMLLTMQDLELTEPLALSSVGEPSLIAFDFWGWDVCSVEVTPTVEVNEVALYDLQSWWTTRGGDAALRVDFDFDAGIEADVSFSRGAVSCSQSWMSRYAAATIDPVLNSTFSVELSRPDLDIWFVFSKNTSNQLEVEVEAQMDIGEILVGNALDLLPSDFKEDLLENQGFRASEHEQNIASGIEAGLEGVAVAIEATADDELDAICSVEYDSGEMLLSSDLDCVSNADARSSSAWSR